MTCPIEREPGMTEHDDQAVDLHGRSLLKEVDFTKDEFVSLVDLAAALRDDKRPGPSAKRMVGRNIALIFEKASTRTRSAFEVGAYDQGAHVTYLGPDGVPHRHKETIKDTARVLGRMYDGIEYRGFAQQSVETLAQFAGVPVWNGLTDQWHPTQMLADILTMRDHSTSPSTSVDLLLPRRRPQQHRQLSARHRRPARHGRPHRRPRTLWPSPEVRAWRRSLAAGSGARVMVTDDVAKAVDGADFVYTDVWVSMGEPAAAWDDRIDQLLPVPSQRRRSEGDGQPGREVHALPTGAAQHATPSSAGRSLAE